MSSNKYTTNKSKSYKWTLIKSKETELDTTGQDAEVAHDSSSEKKIRYPYQVFFIIANEFCERFNYYGMRAILLIYLKDYLLYDSTTATSLYHTFAMTAYFFPVLGAIISDTYLGKFKTIFSLSLVYAVGSVVLAAASFGPFNLPTREISIVGLALIALGTGGIKPCVAAFGGDQFVLPQQERRLDQFFSIFYFSINAGSLISSFTTPILREKKCLGEDSCFSLAFGVPGALMIVSVIVFAIGRPLYKVNKPQGNIMVDVGKCVGHAIAQKIKSKEKKEHWLDYAVDRFGPKFISEVKTTMKVLTMYVTLPIFWALYEQQGSQWTNQSEQLDGDIGFYTILPDQMQTVNSVLILVFIPMFTYIIYPIFAQCNFLMRPLQRMTLGMFLAAVSFVMSGLVSYLIESKGEGKVSMLWQLPQYVTITVAEILFSIPGVEFSFSEAPISMKSLMQAAWLLSDGFGNFLIILMDFVRLEKDSSNYYVYAGLMLADMFLFGFLAMRYKYVDQSENEEDRKISTVTEKQKEIEVY